MKSSDEEEDGEPIDENGSDGIENSKSEDKISEESDQTDAVSTQEGGKSNDEEEWRAGRQ